MAGQRSEETVEAVETAEATGTVERVETTGTVEERSVEDTDVVIASDSDDGSEEDTIQYSPRVLRMVFKDRAITYW